MCQQQKQATVNAARKCLPSDGPCTSPNSAEPKDHDRKRRTTAATVVRPDEPELPQHGTAVAGSTTDDPILGDAT